jgi:two-component system sensor histidine kinase/response regulator
MPSLSAGPAVLDLAVLDLAVLARLVSHNPDLIRRFADKFLIASGDGVAEMDAALATDDRARIAELGHRTASAARAVGAWGMAELCERLEREAARLAPHDLRALVARLAAQHAQVAHQIAQQSAPRHDPRAN